MSAGALYVTPGGLNAPVPSYSHSITDGFPKLPGHAIIESSIAARRTCEVLPVNQGSDKFLEFRIQSSEGHFLDLTSLALEMNINITKEDGSALGDGDKAIFVNSVSQTIFKSVCLYLNEQLIESNPFYSYAGYIKLLTHLSPSKLDTLGRIAFFRNNETTSSTITAADFDAITKDEGKLTNEVNTCFPLMLDVSSFHEYILDSVECRLRLELHSPAWAIMTPLSGKTYKYNINSIKLWIDKVIPYTNALIALNSSMRVNSQGCEYLFKKTLFKSYILASNQTQLIADNPWGQVIPDKIFIIIVDMKTYDGGYNFNPLYFQHEDLNHFGVTINSEMILNIDCKFPTHASRLYYATLKSLGLETDHLITYKSFLQGRTILGVDLRSEQVKNAISVEKNGNLRIDMTFGKPKDENRICLMFGETNAILNINENRTVIVHTRV